MVEVLRRQTTVRQVALLGAVVALAGSLALARLEVPPLPRWFYIFAWYPILVLFDLLVVRMGGRSLWSRRRQLAAMLWWSVIIWLLFEVFNFRLRNWYYVFLAPAWPERWAGTVLAFATVVPAILLPERILELWGVGRRWTSTPRTISTRARRLAPLVGTVILGGVLIWPRYLFPLIWGATWLITDPFLYRYDRDRSLLHDIQIGHWGRFGRLLLAGLLAGLIWESLNALARAKWIYTVPFFEEFKLFEMPLLGFLGFPFFALELWSMYHLILALKPRVTAVLSSVIFAVAALGGIDYWTVSSTVPRIGDVRWSSPGVADRLATAGFDDLFRLARTDAHRLGERAGLERRLADQVRGTARLATLRGLGTRYLEGLRSAGVTTIDDLARADAAQLWRAVATGPRPTPAEVRVWVRAARQAVPDADRRAGLRVLGPGGEGTR